MLGILTFGYIAVNAEDLYITNITKQQKIMTASRLKKVDAHIQEQKMAYVRGLLPK